MRRGQFLADQHFSPGVSVLFLDNPRNSELGGVCLGVGNKISMAWSTENVELENSSLVPKEYFAPFLAANPMKQLLIQDIFG